MNKLMLALPLPGVGAWTIHTTLRATVQDIHSVSYLDNLLIDLSERMGESVAFLQSHMANPSDKLALFHCSDPVFRAKAKRQNLDFFEARTARFYLSHYASDAYLSHPLRLAAMIRTLNPEMTNIVFTHHQARSDILSFKELANSLEMQFILIDLVRPDVPALSNSRFRFEGGVLVENRDGCLLQTTASLIKIAAVG